MNTILSMVLLALLAFVGADYVLNRAKVRDPACAVIAAVFAVLCVIFGAGI